jgi:two-component system C4-dicarboxylate transport response regulator DctD
MKGAVVYIDDEPAICRIVQWRLEAAGLPVETFTDARIALVWIGQHEVACVLCDHRMPVMSGVEVRARLEKDVPFWMVTGDLSVGDELASRSDIRGVLQKPIDFDGMLSLLLALD